MAYTAGIGICYSACVPCVAMYAQPYTPPMPKNEVNVNIGEVYVSITTDHDYPDVIDDLIRRTRELCKGIIEDIKINGADIDDIFASLHPSQFEDADDDEDED
jgi:hypothetical protein